MARSRSRPPAKAKPKRRSSDDRPSIDRLQRRIEKLTSLLDVAKALTATRDLDGLLKLILNEAVKVVRADRCTLWIVDREEGTLWTKVAQGLENEDTIRIPMGVGIAGQVAETGEIINIPDAYADSRFNPTIDRDTGYRTHHILGVPMRYHTGEVTGVLQALNKVDPDLDAFTEEDEELLLALGANAAAAIENVILYQEIDRLFEGFVKASVVAIESRDPTTSGHSERVALLTMGIAEQVDRSDASLFRELRFNIEDMREIRYAALLHDFGKVGVREHVLTKANKLYPGELEAVEARFATLRAQRENEMLRTALRAVREGNTLPPDHEQTIQEQLKELDELLAFIRRCNQPTVLESEGFDRLREISRVSFLNADRATTSLLTEHELRRLSIPRGTLDQQERLEIESHVTHTFRFLSQIPWTRGLRRIPEIAYAHHEKLDGAGYPRGLQASQIPIQSQMMTIADIYDALTASDRPYKRAVPHERALDILHQESKQNRIDNTLLEVFVEANVHRCLAKAEAR